jgi:hypothetical protein
MMIQKMDEGKPLVPMPRSPPNQKHVSRRQPQEVLKVGEGRWVFGSLGRENMKLENKSTRSTPPRQHKRRRRSQTAKRENRHCGIEIFYVHLISSRRERRDTVELSFSYVHDIRSLR